MHANEDMQPQIRHYHQLKCIDWYKMSADQI